MIDIDRLLDRIDELYGAVVMDPTSWSDSTIHDWAGELFDAEKPDKETARGVRRCVRAAIKLQLFWIDSSNSRVDDAEDWRARVDIALGGPAWRPTLELAQHGLAQLGLGQHAADRLAQNEGRVTVRHPSFLLRCSTGFDWCITNRGLKESHIQSGKQPPHQRRAPNLYER